MFTKKLSTQFTASLLSAVSGILEESTSLRDTLKRERSAKEKKEPLGVSEESDQINERERVFANDYDATSEKSQFGGHRPHVTNKETGRTMYLGQDSYKKPEHARDHAKAYLDAYAGQGSRAASDASMDFARKNKSHMHESADQINELSKGTLGSYVKKATNQAFNKSFAGGANLSRGAEKEGEAQVNKAVKRVVGVNKAVNKLTKEEQEFIEALNADTLDEASIRVTSGNKGYGYHGNVEARDDAHRDKRYSAMHRYAKQLVSAAGHLEDAKKPNVMIKHFLDSPHGRHIAHDPTVKNITSRFAGFKKIYDSSMHEEVELDEARGRPKKAGGKDFTINPKTKEKLMHDNPEHMKKIEALQRNGVIPEPKIEANQHVMQQLQRAKLSMRGGETVHFTHGDSHHVAGDHAAKLLTKYAGMKPDEKEAFQKKISHSHANLKSEI